MLCDPRRFALYVGVALSQRVIDAAFDTLFDTLSVWASPFLHRLMGEWRISGILTLWDG